MLNINFEYNDVYYGADYEGASVFFGTGGTSNGTRDILQCRNETVHIYKKSGFFSTIGYYFNKWFNKSTWTEVEITINYGNTIERSIVLVKNNDIKKNTQIQEIFIRAIQPLVEPLRMHERCLQLWS